MHPQDQDQDRDQEILVHRLLRATDGTGSTVRTALLDFRKAFDLVDHHILVAKFLSLGVKPSVVNWIIDFLRGRQQRVKVMECFLIGWPFLLECLRGPVWVHGYF